MTGKPHKELQTKNDAILFDILLIIFFMVITLVAFNYNARARSIPLALGIVGAMMTFLQLLVDAVPAVGAKLRFIGASGIWVDEAPLAPKGGLHTESEAGADDAPSPVSTGKARKGSVREWWGVFRIVLWLGGFILLLVATNYLIAVAVFVVLMARVEGGESWKRSVILGLCVVASFYLLFEVLLHAQL